MIKLICRDDQPIYSSCKYVKGTKKFDYYNKLAHLSISLRFISQAKNKDHVLSLPSLAFGFLSEFFQVPGPMQVQGVKLGIFLNPRAHMGGSSKFFQVPEPIWGQFGIFPSPKAST